MSRFFKLILVMLLSTILISETPVYAVEQGISTDEDFASEVNNRLHDAKACDPNLNTATTAAATANDTGVTPGDVYIMGDSITNIAKDTYVSKFDGAGWKSIIQGLDSRHILTNEPSPSGLEQIKQDKDTIKKAKAIVIALGTNDQGEDKKTLAANIKKLIRQARQYNSKATIFWVNIIDKRNLARSRVVNTTISEGAEDVTVIDWYSKAKSKADLESFDMGVHPTKPEDIKLLVDLVYESVSGINDDSAAGVGTGNAPTSEDPSAEADSSTSVSTDVLEGHRLPAIKGGTGYEDPVGPDGLLTAGDVGGKITFPDHVSGGQEYQDYYIAMRLPYAKWSWNGKASEINNEEKAWYQKKPRKVVVTNKRTNKSIIAVIAEAGPAPWAGAKGGKSENGYSNPQRYTPQNYTGRVSGLPPKAIEAIGAKQTESGLGDTLTYSWAPDQEAPPGPTNINATGVGTTGDDTEPTACVCPASNTSPSSTVSGEGAEAAFKFFVGEGWTKEQAAGIVGNLIVESNVEPQRLQGTPPGKKTPADQFSGGSGWGIAQWTPGSKMINPVKASGKDPNDLAVQLNVIQDGLKGKGPLPEKLAGDQLKTTTSVRQAAEAFQGSVGGNPYFGYERPASRTATIGERISKGEAILRKFGDSVSGGNPSTTPASTETISQPIHCSCNDPEAAQNTTSSSGLQGIIRDAAGRNGGDTTISIQTIDGKIKADVGGDKQKQTRSAYKIYVAYAILKKIESGSLSWSDIESDMENMIVNSNNEAAIELRSKAGGGDKITSLLQNDVGLSDKTLVGNGNPSDVGGTGSQSTANDYVKFLKLLEKKKLPGVEKDTNYDKLLGYMKRAKTDSGRSGIAAGVGDTKVADKPGWSSEDPTATTDVGIVYLDNKPYALAILTDNPNPDGFKGIASIAKSIHENLKSESGNSCEGTNTGDLTSTVQSYAWPDYHPAPYHQRKPAYARAVQTASQKGKYIGGSVAGVAGIDCGGFVTRVLQDSGFDKQYNDTSAGKGNTTGGQIPYLNNSGKWKKINNPTTGRLKPGDVAINDDHTYLYVGKIDSFNSVTASASYSQSGNGRAPMAGHESAADPDFTWYTKKEGS